MRACSQFASSRLSDDALAARLESFREEIAEQVRTQDQALRARYEQGSN